MWAKIIRSKKLITIFTIMLLVSLSGCGEPKLETISENRVEDESTISNRLDEEILKGENIVEYDFKSDTRVIQVKVKYNNKAFTYDNGLLVKDTYSLEFYLKDDKTSLYEPMKNSVKGTLNYSELTVDKKEAIRSTMDKYATVSIKIDDTTVLSIIGRASEFTRAEDIFNDSDYKSIIKNIKISVKEK